MKNLSFNLIALLALAGLASMVPARATFQQVNTYSATDGGLDGNMSTTDLIELGQSPTDTTLASSSLTGQFAGTTTALQDGNNGTSINASYGNGSYTFTFDLNLDPGTGGSATGYSIKDINTFSDYVNYFATGQYYTVSFETIASPNSFVDFGSFANNAYGEQADSAEISLNDTTGAAIATGVTAVRISNNGLGYIQNTVFTETDVIGSPTVVPEPATWALMLGGLGFLGFWLRRRRA